MDGWEDEWLGRWMDEWTDGQIDGWMGGVCYHYNVTIDSSDLSFYST